MGADPRIHIAVPSGADLSSSHSLECAAALALAGLHELDLSRAELVRLVQHAENDYVGEPDRAILVDSRHLTAEPVPCKFAAVGLDLVWSTPGHGTGMRTASTAPVAPPASRRQRPSGSATSATWSTSTTRSLASPTRSPCGGAATSSARTLGSSTPSSCSVRDGCARSARCSRRRTRRSATTTRPPSPSSTWPSRPLSARGALGARMIGGGFGGFGGSVIAPVDQADRRTVEVAVEDAFRQRGFGKPEFHLGRPSRGAGRDR
jgi:galactokinase